MKVSCRKSFTEMLLEQAKTNEAITVFTTDSRGSVTLNDFAKELPNQFYEMGIAEQNAISVAAGYTLGGDYNAFVCGPACFLSARGYEQIKVDVAYNRTNVKIVGVSAGVSYGPLGGTHTTLHDYAGMRALPNLQVLAPSDGVQARAITKYLTTYEGPAYMRMGRGDVNAVYEENEEFTIGEAKQICHGKDITLIACGEMVWQAKKAAELLEQDGVKATVLDMFTIKPIDVQAILRAAEETKNIITIEEHSIYGGLGEAVAHVAAEKSSCTVKCMGFPDEEYKVGSSEELFEYYGLTAKNITKEALLLLGKG